MGENKMNKINEKKGKTDIGMRARSRSSLSSCIVFVMLVVLLFSGIAHAGFQRSYLTVKITLAEDGSAKVREELRFYINSSDSVELYKVSLKVANNLAGWNSRIGLQDVRYHLDTSVVQISDVQLQPLSPDTCDYYRNTCYGTFVTEYTVAPPADGKGILTLDRYTKPRVIIYTFNPRALLFESSMTGESYIPDYTTLEVNIPSGSKVIAVSPRPAEYADVDSVPPDATKFTWHGRLVMSNMVLKFERKISLIDEVIGFFASLKDTLVNMITSREGMTLIAVAIIFIVGYLALQRKTE
jgi:hypothetical protein